MRRAQSNSYETLVGRGLEAARFDAAFFRYLERNALVDDEGPMIMRSLPEGDYERKTVVLWNGAAAADFAKFWRQCVPTEASVSMGSANALSLD